jgi:serine/threonine protein kinase
MSLDRDQQIYAVFEAAVKSDSDGRSALLGELCAGDLDLRAEVERLLAEDAEAERDGFLASPASMDREAPRTDSSTDEESEFDWARALEGTNTDVSGTETIMPPGLAEHPDYEIKRRLGRGGMGLVYLAENRLTGRAEVLKVVGQLIMERPGALERFLREIRAVAKLRHPNIVTAYYAARLSDSVVLAMEYVDGLDLAEVVKARGPLPVSDACDHVHQAALGLQHAHEHEMVHRDVKPSNLILTRQGDRDVVKVLDFGLAKVRSEQPTDGTLTYEGQMLGTPDYIAPEQISDARRADIRADIYSLGATLYYLLVGGPPFPRTSLYDILQAHHSADATPLNEARADVPVELAALVSKMMAKDPERRFRTPAEVAEALLPFLGPEADRGSGSAAEISRVGPTALSHRPGGVRSGPPQSATAGAYSPGSTPVRRRRRILALAAGGALLLALAVASVLILMSREGTSRTASWDSAPNRAKNSVGMTLVLIPPGEFEMGSDYGPPGEDDRPPHPVRISRPFYLAACEVTQEQYETIMGKNPSHFSGRPNNPVDDVSWIDAITFCNELRARYEISVADPEFGLMM